MSKSIDMSFNQSISHGTLRDEDLITAFYSAYSTLAPLAAVRLYRDRREEFQANSCELVTFLHEKLEELAPYGYYFGAIEGDGSDFGFWRVPELWDGDRLLTLSEVRELVENDGANYRG